MILTRYFTFAAPPKCGCLWFRQILRDQGIGVFGETEIPKVDGFELQRARDSFRHHVPGRLPSVTIVRDWKKWRKSYLHHFKGKRMAIEAVDFLIPGKLDKEENSPGHIEGMFHAYRSDHEINLDEDPGLDVIWIFRKLNIPHDANQILSLAPVNVTDFSVKVP